MIDESMKVCIFTMICNEQRYIDEWIEYNFKIGFDTIIFYEDWTSDIHDFSKWTNELVQKRIVVHRIPNCFNPIEMAQYELEPYRRHIVWEHFNRVHRKEFDWAISVDIDEFIETDNIRDLIDENYLEIRMHWKIYTYSGHFEDPFPGQSYSVRDTYKDFDPNVESKHVKSFLNLNDERTNLRYGDIDNNPHRFLKDTTYVKYIDTTIAHYVTRSLEEYIDRTFFSVGQEKKSWWNKNLDYFFEMNLLDIDDFPEIYEKYIDLVPKTNDHIVETN